MPNMDLAFMLSFVAQYNKRETLEGKQKMKDFAFDTLTDQEYKMFLNEIKE